jgi:hypothetical protein
MRFIDINTNSLRLMVLLTLAQWAVRLLFEYGVAPLADVGLPFAPQSGALSLIAGMLLTALAGAILPPKVRSLTAGAVWMLYFLLVMPGWVMMHSMGEERVLVTYVLAVACPIIVLGAIARAVPPASPTGMPNLSSRVAGLATIALLAFTVLVVWRSGEVDLAFDAVYERRLAFRDGPGGIVPRMVFWIEHAVVPVALVVSLCARQWCLVAAALALSACPFLIYGSKLALLWPLVLVGCWAMRRVGLVSAVGISGVLTAVLWIAVAAGNMWVNDYIVRRSLCVPSALTFVYLAEWEARPPMLWRDSPLVAEVLYGTSAAPPLGRLVGEEVLGKQDLNASVDVFSNGFAEGWYPGVYLVGVVVLAVLVVNERTCRNMGQDAAALFGIQFGMILAIQPLHSAMISGGLVLISLLIWWCGRGSCIAPPPYPSQP